MVRALIVVGLAAALFSAPFDAEAAEPKDLSELRSNRYYYLHTGLTLAAFLGTGVEELASAHHGPGWDLDSFGPDDAVRRNFSESAARLSDKLLALNLTAPLFLQMSQGFGTRMANASLIYSEAISFNLLAADTAKIIVRRPRPYTHSKDPRILDFMDRQGADAYSSFYSAHASTAFTAATAGSILYAAQTDELVARHTVWGLTYMLAGMTAQLRTRAGRHYRTDIWVGTLAGIATGTLVPLLHRLDLQRIRGTELATAGGALGVTMLLSEVVDFCAALDVLHLCGLPRDVAVPLRDASLTPTWRVVPRAFVGGAGLSVLGEL
jgi:membrane-associated phospholipid phosphatase